MGDGDSGATMEHHDHILDHATEETPTPESWIAATDSAHHNYTPIPTAVIESTEVSDGAKLFYCKLLAEQAHASRYLVTNFDEANGWCPWKTMFEAVALYNDTPDNIKRHAAELRNAGWIEINDDAESLRNTAERCGFEPNFRPSRGVWYRPTFFPEYRQNPVADIEHERCQKADEANYEVEADELQRQVAETLARLSGAKAEEYADYTEEDLKYGRGAKGLASRKRNQPEDFEE
jgi:hypothetical protein